MIAVGEREHRVVEREPADPVVAHVGGDDTACRVDHRRGRLPCARRAAVRRVGCGRLRVRQQRGEHFLAHRRRVPLQRVRHRDQCAGDRVLGVRAAAAAVHEQEVQPIGVRDAEGRTTVAADGDVRGPVLLVA